MRLRFTKPDRKKNSCYHVHRMVRSGCFYLGVVNRIRLEEGIRWVTSRGTGLFKTRKAAARNLAK
jgi:hypothetical protein